MNYQYFQSFPDVNVQSVNRDLIIGGGRMVDQTDFLEKKTKPRIPKAWFGNLSRRWMSLIKHQRLLR